MPFMKWWLNYLNFVIKLSDDFDNAELAFPNAFWDIEREKENLFFSSSLLSLLNRIKAKRLYFIGQDVAGVMETNIRLARCLEFDPVLVWNSTALGELPDHDRLRLERYCEIHEVDEFVSGFERGWSNIQIPPRRIA